jgi:hypothetical protein
MMKDHTANHAWLKTYLEDAVRRDLCTKLGCTTCGAIDFRRGLLRAYGSATGYPDVEFFDPVNALGMIGALAALDPPTDLDWKITAAVRCILFDVWSVLGPATVRSVLATTWAGTILRSMEEHHRRVQAAHRGKLNLKIPFECSKDVKRKNG